VKICKPSTIFLSIPFFFFFTFFLFSCNTKQNTFGEEKENDMYDGPDKAAEFQERRTMDPALGYVPRERLATAIEEAKESKLLSSMFVSAFGSWTERGPNSDAVGPSSGNTRANSGVAAGRSRALLVDAADVTNNTVWIGSVAGGLWKTTDISASPATWTLVDDFLSNMSISSICQDPTNSNTMYFATGESYFNADAVGGDGVFKSTDHGVSWTQLSSTTIASFDYCTRILCDASGNVYVSTRSGVFRSTNGGTSWTTITPSGLATSRISDMELSSTGRLHISSGIFSTCEYRFTSSPSTVTSATWTSPTSGYPTSAIRIELGCKGNTLYALPSDGTYQVPTLYKSTDGGATWAATTGQPTAGWASGQAWYALAVDIDPTNTNNVIVGGLEPYKSTDGGATWARIGRWVGTTGQYVHADIHKITWVNASRLLISCDGGVHYSNDAGATFRDRNVGLRIKQFYSCAIHPSTTNYFLAGAQDNGSHQFSNAGLSTTVEVTGGDGAYVHIDQNEPAYQFTSYVYNQYRRSTNSGATWTSVDLSTNTGQFINPTDYDDANNIMYCGSSPGTYRRWTNPQTGATSAEVTITTLAASNTVSAVTVSPYTSNRVYFAAEANGAAPTLCYVDNANSIASGSAATANIITGLPTTNSLYINCIAVGTNDNNLMVSYSNYGVQQVWVSNNGGTSWTNIDGNLPDMPVYWCMFAPGDNTKAIIATEAGVWVTLSINAGSTTWFASPTFPTVRTDMLQYRATDKIVAAATHGRGLWTQPYYSIVPQNNFTLKGKWVNNTSTELIWDYATLPANSILDIEASTDGYRFNKVGTISQNFNNNYKFVHTPTSSSVFYRVVSKEPNGIIKYSNTIRLNKSGGVNGLDIIKVFPNPTQGELKVAINISNAGKTSYTIQTLTGQVLWRKEEELNYAGTYTKNWMINQIPSGTYLFTVLSGAERKSIKFVKQ
jgi:photosystem II stability/assembly factor-like uncharacterized protein